MATINEPLEPPEQTTTTPETSLNTSGFSGAPWPLWLRIVFRFVFCYWVLYNLPFPLNLSAGIGGGLFPGAGYLISGYTWMVHKFVPWVGAHILHLSRPITYFPTGSGDTTSDYVQLLCVVVFAIIATVVWTLLDKRSKQYRTLHEGLRIYVRYALAFTLFGYGFAKWFHGQFGPTSLTRMAEPYGDFSPMGVLWAFMGASFPYMWFTGLVEVSGGFLLLFRRTVTLGVLVSLAAMLDVALLNYFYDVPVKLFSTNLLLMGVFLLVPDVRRLINVFLLNRTAAPANIAFPWKGRRWMRPTRIVVKTLVILMALYGSTFGIIFAMNKYRGMMKHSPLYGIYNVVASSQSPAVSNEALQWKTLVFEYPQGMAVFTADDSAWRYGVKIDTAKKQISIMAGFNMAEENGHRNHIQKKKSEPVGVLTYSVPDVNHLVLQGTLEGQPVHMTLYKVDASKFVLKTRSYHWVSEYPFNR